VRLVAPTVVALLAFAGIGVAGRRLALDATARFRLLCLAALVVGLVIGVWLWFLVGFTGDFCGHQDTNPGAADGSPRDDFCGVPASALAIVYVVAAIVAPAVAAVRNSRGSLATALIVAAAAGIVLVGVTPALSGDA
jgi:hypothetical protein